MCSHGGQATPPVPNPRILVGGQPTALISAPWIIAGCPLVPPLPLCVTGMWVMGTTRVTSNGQPLVVQSGVSVCAASGSPMLPVAMQTRVIAT